MAHTFSPKEQTNENEKNNNSNSNSNKYNNDNDDDNNNNNNNNNILIKNIYYFETQENLKSLCFSTQAPQYHTRVWRLFIWLTFR